MSETGIVYLVGAGPGDPGLITVRGVEVLRSADAVVFDRLVHPDVLGYASPNAERIFVGKAPDHHSRSQHEINAILVELGRSGRKVVRLKGGDPFVFGRGAEEAEALRAAGVRFEVVPGVTSAVAAPAYAGIPVTYRNVATNVAVVTGRLSDPEEEPDWERVAGADTIVILMGLGRLRRITRSLMAAGRRDDTPAAVIRSATTESQVTVAGTLANIADRASHLKPPAVIVIGDVVRLGESLDWYSSTPSPVGGEEMWPAELVVDCEVQE